MNAKLCKHLRRMARQMSFDPKTSKSLPARRLMVLPSHEKRFKFQRENGMPATQGISAINDPNSTRGIYRWLKKEFRHGSPDPALRGL